MDNKDRKENKSGIIKYVLGVASGIALCALLIYLSGSTLILRFVGPGENEANRVAAKYASVMEMIDELALNDHNESEITDEVLASVADKLGDKYARYYTAEEYSIYARRFAETYVGIGITIVELDDGKVMVIGVTSGRPADEAGIKVGDIVTMVDGKQVTDSTDASTRMAGEEGTEVTVTVERDGRTIDFTMKRAEIDDRSVTFREYDKKNKIAYVRLSIFKKGTASDFRETLDSLSSKGYTKLVLDLRSNGGGSTEEAYDVADILLPECRIVTEKNSRTGDHTYSSDEKYADFDFVVLVDSNTASASEIVSAAIKGNKAGKIIGTNTYGKGVTQLMRKFADGSAFKLTIEEFFGPNGEKINGVGVAPDIEYSDPSDFDGIMGVAVKELLKK